MLLDTRTKRAVMVAASVLRDISMKLDHIINMLRDDLPHRRRMDDEQNS